MPAPDLAFVKTWCRVDGFEFDLTLPVMIEAATAMASHEVGIDYTTEDMPHSVQMWVCAQVMHWIDNPNAATERQQNPSPFLAGLLDPYRMYKCPPLSD